MCCSQRHDARATQHFQQRRLRVRQEGKILEFRHPLASDNLVELLLHRLGDLGMVEHEYHRPLEARLDRLHAGREKVTDDLLDLAICGHQGRTEWVSDRARMVMFFNFHDFSNTFHKSMSLEFKCKIFFEKQFFIAVL